MVLFFLSKKAIKDSQHLQKKISLDKKRLGLSRKAF
jgi:hypothetical protein